MKKESLDFLKHLLACPTPSGYEEPGQEIVRTYMEKYADAVETDVHGNVFGILNKGAKKKVMLSGHCDEIGLIVMYIDKDGYLYFDRIGGVNVPLLQGERVVIHTKKGPLPGVIGVRPIHLMDEKERSAGQGKIHALWIDIGCSTKKEAEALVRVGDVATIDTGWIELQGGKVACRGFDNRIGSFIVAEVLRELRRAKLDVAVYAVSTVAEEIGLRGARTASEAIRPDVGIAIDVGHATDAPNVDPKMVGEASLGKGPILHRGPNFNHRLYDALDSTAAKAKIPVQLQAIGRASGTDANMMQVSSNQCAAALVAIPNRYMHSPVEVIHLKDVENTVKLLAAFIKGLKANASFVPK